MGRWHVICQGESVASLAELAGHAPNVLWNHPHNAELRRLRSNMNALAPGDRLFIPVLEPRKVTRPLDARHCFRKRGVPARLRLRLDHRGQPRAGIGWRLEFDGDERSGVTDERGVLEAWIPPRLARAKLRVEGRARPYLLRFGELDPQETLRGVQQRLRNLGYDCPTSGELDEPTRAALQSFQRAQGLPLGELDQATQDRLRSIYASMEDRG